MSTISKKIINFSLLQDFKMQNFHTSLNKNKDKLSISIYIHTFVTFMCDVCLMCADMHLQNLHF